MERLSKWTLGVFVALLAGLIAPAAIGATVDINTADARALDRVLVGVGPAKAEAIVEYRRKNGPFRSAEELVKVRGIGPKTVEKNRARIRVDASGADPARAYRGEPGGESRPQARDEYRPLIYRVAPTPRP
jgi:competence protein ComEA